MSTTESTKQSTASTKVDVIVQSKFKKLPVTVLSGFLGSGKTTLLKHLLESNHGLKIALIVQDMASINIDADRIRIVKEENKMVQLQNGCICCSLREDLLVEISALAAEQKFDYLIIEGTGVSEPMHVAETFTYGSLHEHGHTEEGDCEPEDDDQPFKVLSDVSRLDTMVTVMDVKQFFDYLVDDSDVTQKWTRESTGEDDEGKTVCTLMIDQIEFADVILLNKIDLVTKDELEKIRALVHKLNPVAKILETTYSKVDPKLLINTGLFDFEKAHMHAGWLKELRGEHVPPTKKYGISSFIYACRRQFSAERLADLFLSDTLMKEGVIRAKGVLWLDCSYETIVEFDICGASTEVTAQSSWFAEIRKNSPEEWWALGPDVQEKILEDFKGPEGDRRQEMIFIGHGMDESKLRSMLYKCLLTNQELKEGKGILKGVPNPFFPEEESDMEESTEAAMDQSEEIEMGDEPQQGESFIMKESKI